jgi:hypothetical protein
LQFATQTCAILRGMCWYWKVTSESELLSGYCSSLNHESTVT